MFTGIIETTGKIKSLSSDRLVIEASTDLLSELNIGSSIAVDGACLTVIEKADTTFTVDFMPETADNTIILSYQVGDPVNLELPMRADGRFDGHMVMGHVDGVGEITHLETKENSHILTVKIATELQKYIVAKGSVTLNGISLTVAEMSDVQFTVHLIPHTWEHTNLHNLQVGAKVNVETDILGKYVEKMTNHD